MTRVNSEIDMGLNKYQVMKERKMNDNPRRPITYSLAGKQ
jgi:hypothetical protein